MIEKVDLPIEEKIIEISFIYILTNKGKVFSIEARQTSSANVSEIRFSEKIIKISGYRSHILGLTDTGKIICYGDNEYNQAPPYVDPPIGERFVEISTNRKFSLGLTNKNKVIGWGKNNYGQAPPEGINV